MKATRSTVDTPADERRTRRERLLRVIQEGKANAFVTTALPNVRYLCGFTGSNAALLMNADRAVLLTDPRYGEQAAQECDCQVRVVRGPLVEAAGKWLTRWRERHVAFERNRLSFLEYERLKRFAITAKLHPLSDAVERLRMVKSPEEIDRIRQAVHLNSEALEESLQSLQIGKTTEAELASEIEYRMRRLGADSPSFESIVASGERSALPHARPTREAVQPDDLLLVDIGATVSGYASDMTRTFATGKLTRRRRGLYAAVLESQLAAIDAIRPGVAAGQVDRAARSVLKVHGLENLFVHSTGHGLGIEIHEGPRVGRKEGMILEEGMTITVEPGVYDAGQGGVRIEDTILVTAGAAEVLTPTSKELRTL